jgi:hypothetical protein
VIDSFRPNKIFDVTQVSQPPARFAFPYEIQREPLRGKLRGRGDAPEEFQRADAYRVYEDLPRPLKSIDSVGRRI